MEFTVRRAVEEDYEGLCEIYLELDQYHRDAMPNIFKEYEGPARPIEYISQILNDEDSALFTAESDGRVIGFIHIYSRETPYSPLLNHRVYAVINDIAVRTGSMRIGVGRALMDTALQWALDKGINQIELNVWEFNKTAIEFYENLGYKTEVRKMWLNLGG